MQLPRQRTESFIQRLITETIVPSTQCLNKCANLWLRIFQQGGIKPSDCDLIETLDKNASSICKTWICENISSDSLIPPCRSVMDKPRTGWQSFNGRMDKQAELNTYCQLLPYIQFGLVIWIHFYVFMSYIFFFQITN